MTMCPEIEAIAEKLVDHEIVTEPEAAQFRHHLSTCTTCAQSFADMQKLQHLIQRGMRRGDQHLSIPELQALLQNAGSGSDYARMPAHLRHCQECRESMRWLRVLAVMEKEFTLSMPLAAQLRIKWNVFSKRKKGVWAESNGLVSERAIKHYGYAAAVILGLAVIGLALQIKWPSAALLSAHSTVQEKPATSPVKKINPDNIARHPVVSPDHFLPWPELEELVGAHLRTDQLTVLQPHADTMRTAEIQFKWQGVDTPLIFKILNNSGEMVLQAPAVTGQYTCRKALSPGVYYWKLENSDELLWIGKFIIPVR
jgi:hypothetical protein